MKTLESNLPVPTRVAYLVLHPTLPPFFHKPFSKFSPELQTVVERVLLLQSGLKQAGMDVPIDAGVASVVAQYAGLLANQGALDVAIACLSHVPVADDQVGIYRGWFFFG